MRQPTFSRSSRRSRQQRLLRTGIIAALIVASAAVAVSLLAGGDGPGGDPEVEQVSFTATSKGYGDKRPSKQAVETEGAKIVELLEEWYQQAFVDPELYGDGTFEDVAEHFEEAARAQFTKDIAALTIGEARTEVASVDPETATADIAVYFDDGTKPIWASALVRFTATGTLKEGGALPLRIDQRVKLFFKRSGDDWRVSTFYDASQTQRSVQPSPTGSPS